ncbi:MAG TPA: RagB/SusD family nutrient uptake outer membrane protein [Cryomorphaceae bacterium]|nr:RagB/SusD family nutrient uptake outer membrane protein [Cryomorphaceae bacterium]
MKTRIVHTAVSFHWSLVLLLALGLVACDDLLEQKPPLHGSNVSPDEAIQSANDLQELLNSAYDVLGNTYNGAVQNLMTLLTDNAARPNNHDDYTSIWLRSTTVFNGTLGGTFHNLYIAVLRGNTVIENLHRVSDLSPEDRRRMEAEARFIRALCHFDAVRGWAQPYGYTPGNTHPGVAIRTNTLIETVERSSVAAVYNLILSDLSFASENLPEFNDVYATKWSAMALEAEVRFQMHDYPRAYELADAVISTGPFSFDTQTYNKYVHPQPGTESIFYIFSAIRSDANVDSRNGGFRGNYYAGSSRPTLGPSEELYELSQTGATPSSLRAGYFHENSIDGNTYFTTTMFDSSYFNVPVLTVTQMKLIRAESAAEMNQNLDVAIADVNDIRERAFGNNLNNLVGGVSPQTIIEAARRERRLEFPFNGQRLHDVKRIGSQGEHIEMRGAPWDCPGMLLQFPSSEQTANFPMNPRGGC